MTSVDFRDLRASESKPRADAGALLASVELEAPGQEEEVGLGLLGLEGLFLFFLCKYLYRSKLS